MKDSRRSVFTVVLMALVLASAVTSATPASAHRPKDNHPGSGPGQTPDSSAIQAVATSSQPSQVDDAQGFSEALANAHSGDTITLAPGVYPSLTVSGLRFSRPVTISGSRSVQIGELVFDNASGFILSGVTVTPVTNTKAEVLVTNGSSDITVDDVRFDGKTQALGVLLKTETGTSDVTLENSELTRCSQRGTCIDAGATNLRVLNNNFDCSSCIFTTDSGNGALVEGNSFSGSGNGTSTGSGTGTGSGSSSGSNSGQVSTSSASTPAAVTSSQPLQVHDAQSFTQALAKAHGGDTISLAPGTYPSLTVSGLRFTKPVTITGPRSVQVGELDFRKSSGFVLSGVTIAPTDNSPARVWVTAGSSGITVNNVLFDGKTQAQGAFLKTDDDTSNVTLENSELTDCGQNGKCVDLGASNLQVLNNNFHDCLSCIFIKGSGNGALVRGNTFQRTGPGTCQGGEASCPHNDEIAIFGGGPWTIEGNRFGDMKQGTAQIYVQSGNHPTHDVLIADNIFGGDAPYAVRIGVGGGQTPPSNVRVVNNTMLSGNINSFRLNPEWDGVPNKPLVANNIFASLAPSNCTRGTFVSNLVISGNACGGDVGAANLDPNDSPTSASTLVINRANLSYAPQIDYYGNSPLGDRGAVKYKG